MARASFFPTSPLHRNWSMWCDLAFKLLSSSSWVVTMLQGSAPDSCTTWQGKWAGEGSRDAPVCQWAAVLPQKALCMLGAFPSFVWGTSPAKEYWRDGKRTGSTGATAITLYSCLWCHRAVFGDPGVPCPSYKRLMVFRYARYSRTKPSSPWILNAVTDWEANLTWQTFDFKTPKWT